MSQRVCIVDMPGLSRALLEFVPKETALGEWLVNKPVCDLTPTFPAVTCSVQASLTTGKKPSEHGIVANGVATFRSAKDKELVDGSNFGEFRRQISFWEQSNQFLEAPRFWKGKWRTSLLFFQNSMPGFAGTPAPAADIVLTPKPDHGPDGKLTSLCWSEPRDLVGKLFAELGPFPLMNYWGPMAGIASSQWIGKAAAWVWRNLGPQLQLVYVPHLDYDLQRFGPDSAQAKKAVVDTAMAVEPLIRVIREDHGKLVLLSEYAMQTVSQFVQPNRLLAEAGLLETRQTGDGWLIDYEKSAAVAMCDHQVAHVYVRDAGAMGRVRKALEANSLLSFGDPAALGFSHRRTGDLLLVAKPDAWFDYRWWSDETQRPKFARMVDIHRKPGYDPLELFFDPVAKGTSQDGRLVKGSHGRLAPPAVLAADADLPGECSIPNVAGIVTQMLDK